MPPLPGPIVDSLLTILVVLGGIFCKISSALQSYIIWLKSALLEVEALIRGSKIGFHDPASRNMHLVPRVSSSRPLSLQGAGRRETLGTSLET